MSLVDFVGLSTATTFCRFAEEDHSGFRRRIGNHLVLHRHNPENLQPKVALMTITLDTARNIIAETRAHAVTSGCKPLTVVVLDAGGHILAVEREDGSSNKRFEIAYGKAHGAISMGVGSRALMERAERQPYFIAAATLAIGGALVPVPGGVLVYRDGVLVGAAGATGDTSDNDEAAIVAGIQAAGLSAETG